MGLMLLDELGAWLAAAPQSIGVAGTDLFLGSTPDSPDACTTVREYAGEAPERTLGPSTAYEQPRIQIVCRAGKDDYAAARTKAEAVYKVIDKAELTLSGVHYLRIEPLQSPFTIGRDENDRWLIGFNASVMKEIS